MDIGDICITDSATTHTTLQSEKYFSHLTIAKSNVGTISGTSDLIEGSGMASFVLSNGTQMRITDALYSTKSRRNLLSFKDIRRNSYHIETTNESGNKGDRTKHISPKFFYTHELQKNGDIDVQQIRSSNNLTDLFTKALPGTTFKKLRHDIGMRQIKDLH
ncbi:hypothetical protein CFOL_v3_06243 [Cephalotus follicularis]|uniref:Retrovirus-related Pol polyprotein from transposon TNT 1-94-like beta-barrel domain-containing protein n=1 Tax=Cephalotus follicularis TaxID=3775 RepID=A0A1Q3B441_CEPFO|nr:hypothetical protein CFOL_v3_06243 [Cephalotus follicularis]